MTRQVWERTITDAAGNVQTGVQVTVFQSDGATIATIYGQQSGGAAQANPFNTGSQTTAKFYAEPGRYVIRVVKDGLTKEFWDQDIGGKAVRDDIGSAAYLVASSGVGDTTIGRAARIGDHGLGLDGGDMFRVTPYLDCSGGVDFNDLTKPGWYKVLINASNSANYPPLFGVSGYWFVFTIKYANTQAQQYAYPYLISNASGCAVYVRAKYGDVWTTWQQSSAPVVGPVGYDAGIGRNVGAVLEFGTNSNGSYLKLADGTVKAWGRVIVTGVSINPAKAPNTVTGHLCDPVMPTTIFDKVLSLGQHALYDSSDRLIYSVEAASTAGMPMILNLGTRPDGTWPRLDEFGTSIAVKVDYFWSAVGRWR